MSKVLNDLIDLGTTKKDISAFGKTWKMHTLNTKDQLTATNSTSEYDTFSRVVALKVAILANAVDSVDGQSLGNRSEKREIFGKLPIPIINALYNEYEKLVNIQNDNLDKLMKDTNTVIDTDAEENIDETDNIVI